MRNLKIFGICVFILLAFYASGTDSRQMAGNGCCFSRSGKVAVGITAAYADTGSGVVRKRTVSARKNPAEVSLIRRAIDFLVDYQRDIREKMVALAKESSSRRNPSMVAVLLFLSFLYGVVHAAGPGHGKVALCSYVMAPGVGVARGALLGLAVALLHSLSAILLVSASFFSIRKTDIHLVNNMVYFRKASAILLIVLGVFMLARVLYSMSGNCGKDGSGNGIEKASFISNLPITVIIGLVPCSGIVILILFINATGIWNLGIPLIVSMIAGMGLTLSVTGALMVLLRQGVLFPVDKMEKGKTAGLFRKSIQVASPLLLVLVGLVLL